MSTDSYIPMTARVERIEREKAYEAGFAAALSEHEQIGWWDVAVRRFYPLDEYRLAPFVTCVPCSVEIVRTLGDAIKALVEISENEEAGKVEWSS